MSQNLSQKPSRTGRRAKSRCRTLPWIVEVIVEAKTDFA
jgi:hypothetical protein